MLHDVQGSDSLLELLLEAHAPDEYKRGIETGHTQRSGGYRTHLLIQGSAYVAGNQTAIGGYAFGYDAENRMISSTVNGGTTQYGYDGDGRRVTKTMAGATTTYVYDAMGQLVAEYGALTALDSGTKYVTVDHLGSTRLVTDSSGNPERCYDYLPFGEEIASGTDGRTGNCFTSAATPLTQKFTGKERDAETGLDYFGARYMSSAQGRFTSPDPEGAGATAFDPHGRKLTRPVRV